MRSRLLFRLLIGASLAAACSDATGGGDRRVDSIELERTTDIGLLVGDSIRISAAALSTGGDALPGVAIMWTSDDNRIATVSPSGVVRGVAPGATAITAAAGGREARLGVRVLPRAASIRITGLPQAWAVDDTLRPTILALDSAGWRLPGEVAVTGVSSNPAVLQIAPDGAWVSGTGGSATITLSAAGAQREVQVTVVAFESVEAGADHTCATTEDKRLYCWGAGDQGRAVPGRLSHIALPTPAKPGYRFEDVGAGLWHTCGIEASGQTICWGDGTFGQLTGALTGSSHRVASGPPFAGIAGDWISACGVAVAGGVYCWGEELDGRPFGSPPTILSEPVAIVGAETLVRVEMGSDFACGLDAAGRAMCWGKNGSGELGTPPDTGRPMAAPVETDLRFKDIALGTQSTCGITLEGKLFCWGSETWDYSYYTRSYQQLYIPQHWTLPEPAVAVTGGWWNMCALGESGAAYCFGHAIHGTLGSGITSGGSWYRNQIVAGGHRFRSIAHGDEHVCAVTQRGAIHCWGSDNLGTTYPVPRKLRPAA